MPAANPSPPRPEPDPARAAHDWVRALYAEHGRALRAVAYSVLHDEGRAEDVVQETLVRAWQHRAHLDTGAPLRGWLATVARNHAIDLLRRRGGRPQEVHTGDDLPDRAAAATDPAAAISDQLELRAALDTLGPKHRPVVERLYLDDKGVREVAAELGIPAGTVKSRAHHALRQLYRVLGGGEATPTDDHT